MTGKGPCLALSEGTRARAEGNHMDNLEEQCTEYKPGTSDIVHISTILPGVLDSISQQMAAQLDKPSSSEARGYRWAA